LCSQKLLLYNNRIKDLPANFPPALSEINLFNNQVRKLPNSLGDLSQLEEVNFASNKLMMTLDAHFTSWRAVRVLNLYENNMVRCGSLAPCVALEELRLNGNNLDEMPTLGPSHPSLSILEIHKNRLASIGEEYFDATPGLTRLSVWGNQLTKLPASLCRCAQLLGVQAHENQLGSLPAGMPWPASLETLFLQSNPLKTLPADLKGCSRMRRCNVSQLTLDADGLAVAGALKDLCLAKGDGIFWGVDGKRLNAGA
jgi:hypothetical protein